MKITEMVNKIEKITDENIALRKRMDEGEIETNNELTRLENSKDLPYVMTCAYKYRWETPSATITYDSLLSDYKNSNDVNGGDGIMDIKTGVYTVIKPAGYYTITFSGYVYLRPGESLSMYLYHNGTKVPESRWISSESYV